VLVPKQQIFKNGGGTNISNLSQQILTDILLVIPPLPEQQNRQNPFYLGQSH